MKRRRTKRVMVGMGVLLVIGIGIQFVPVKRTNPPVRSDCTAPAPVKSILKRSCYDCHSHETIWPFYSYIAPVSWLVAHDVSEGREKLNFSNWNEQMRDGDIFEEIVEEIEEGEMPLPMYLLAHPDADVSSEEIDVLRRWSSLNPTDFNERH